MPSVSSTSAVAGTSRSDLTPDEAISAGTRAHTPRSADTSGVVGKPRWTPPSPPVPMKRMPTAAAAASVPPTVVAPTAPCTAQGARSRGPSLRAAGGEALELLGGEADHDTAVEHPDGGGHGARGADGGLAREADLDSRRRGEPMRDERRLECDERAPVLERGLNLVGDADEVLHAAQRSRVASPRSLSSRGRRSCARPAGRT